MTTQEYSVSLVRNNGLLKARTIAQKSKNACRSEVWTDLPKGKIFSAGGDERKFKGITQRGFNKTFSFWSEVVNILNKMK